MSSESFMFLSTLKREDVWWKTSSHAFKSLTVGTTQQNLWVGIKAKVWVTVAFVPFLIFPFLPNQAKSNHITLSHPDSNQILLIVLSGPMNLIICPCTGFHLCSWSFITRRVSMVALLNWLPSDSHTELIGFITDHINPGPDYSTSHCFKLWASNMTWLDDSSNEQRSGKIK